LNTGRRILFAAQAALLWLVAAMAQAGEHGGGRDALTRFSANLNALQASFDQVVLNQEGVVETQGKGRVWLLRPNQFRWSYEGDFPEVIVADGRSVWMHDVVMEQVTVKPQSGMAQDSPLSVLMDISSLDQQFTVRELGKHDGLDLLELVSLSSESEFERVMLGLKEDLIALMVMEDAFGLRTELRFDEVLRNPDLSEEMFQFSPPEGADVVGEIPGEQ